MNPSGRARVEQELIDISVLQQTGLQGISAVHGITDRGPVDSTILVGSWAEFRRHFGGPIADSDFPEIAKRALEAGAKIRVARAVHYTDATDASTIVGTKATIQFIDVGNNITFLAPSIGTWGNSVTVAVAAASNGLATHMNITVTLTGFSELTYTVPNVLRALTATEQDSFNAKSPLVQISAFTAATTTVGSVTLAAGAEDKSLIVTADFVGDSVAGTGMHRFNEDTDFVKIAIPEKADPVIDTALDIYVTDRMDCKALLRTPLGLSGLVAIDYREGQGAYSHTAIDNWLSEMYFGGLVIKDVDTGIETSITVLGDVLGNMSRKDNSKTTRHKSVAGAERGRIYNNHGIDYNLGTAARGTEADQVDIAGINAIIDDSAFAIVIWGKSSLWKADTLLKHAEVGDLIIFLNRAIAPLAKSELFNPNDFTTWASIFRKVQPIFEALVTNRAIWKYKWEGDQDIDRIEDAVINQPADIDAGKYVAYYWIAPIVSLKYIGIKAILTNSGARFELAETGI